MKRASISWGRKYKPDEKEGLVLHAGTTLKVAKSSQMEVELLLVLD